MEKAVGYIRTGPEEERGGPSADTQLDAIKEYCAAEELDVVTVVKDESIPGGLSLSERLGGNDLESIIEGTGVPNIVCMKLDRMFRNAIDAEQQVRRWSERELILHVTDLGGVSANTRSEDTSRLVQMIAGFAELEKNMASERTRSALAVKKANRFVYGTTPYGYDQDGNQLTPNEKEQKILESVRSWHEKGWSLRKIANKLNDRKVPTKKSKRPGGATKWYASTVRYLLTNPLYAAPEDPDNPDTRGDDE